ncbi:MAG: response regulator transcription factor FixJ [Alphaproteobacteria bacterium]|nr:response regulator transcription factor FixJ [Alphaproteobacteria bacterium]
MSELTVHVVDDDEGARDSIAFLLKAAGLSVRCYESASALLERLPLLEQGCIVTDVRMPGINGLELTRRLKDLPTPFPVVMITGHGDVPLAVEAMKAGIEDFIEKPFDDEVLLSAIGLALERTRNRQHQTFDRQAASDRYETLSPREKEVLDGVVAGRANKVIAYDLGISPRTVEIYRANVMTKMQASSLSGLVRMALMLGRSPAGPDN